jgi:hypothetical protein
MRNEELKKLRDDSSKQIGRLKAKRARGERLTRKDCDTLRHAVARLGICAREYWIAAGSPPGFDFLRKPIRLSPLPRCYRPLDLTGYKTGGSN